MAQMMIQEDLFNHMLPRAAAWAQQQEEFILRHSEAFPLTPQLQEIARRAGVQHPDAVRLLAVPEIPLPEEADLREAAAEAFGLLCDGMTLGHGIFVRQNYVKDPKLIAHELLHVAQFERHGSILAFLRQYLSEVNEYGYPAAPMEQEAIVFAEKLFRS